MLVNQKSGRVDTYDIQDVDSISFSQSTLPKSVSEPWVVVPNEGVDMTDIIYNTLLEYSKCVLVSGDYIIHNLVMPDYTTLEGFGYASHIIDETQKAGCAIQMGEHCTVKDMHISGSKSPIALSETLSEHHGIFWTGTYSSSQTTVTQPKSSMISNVYIDGFSGGGITCRNTGLGTNSALMVANCAIENCNAGINVFYESEYNEFTNVRTYNCYYGCINNGGNNIFVNCNFSSCRLGFLIDNSQNQSPNNSHGSAVGCLFNHTNANTGVGIKILNAIHGFIFSGCQIFFSQIQLENSKGIVVSNCDFGSANTDITIKNGGSVIFSSNTHQTAPVMHITNNNKVKFNNCFTRDGEEIKL